LTIERVSRFKAHYTTQKISLGVSDVVPHELFEKKIGQIIFTKSPKLINFLHFGTEGESELVKKKQNSLAI
jgi:hypothetical protein